MSYEGHRPGLVPSFVQLRSDLEDTQKHIYNTETTAQRLTDWLARGGIGIKAVESTASEAGRCVHAAEGNGVAGPWGSRRGVRWSGEVATGVE
jgi:hypothetical protein